MKRLLDRCLSVVGRAAGAGRTKAAGADPMIESLESRQMMSGTLVQLDTDYGKVLLKLRDTQAPITVANFLSYVNDASYTNTFFHRLVADPNFGVLQGGGFRYQNGAPGPITTKPPIALELTGGSNLARTIAMARTDAPNSATSQFFINTINNTSLDTTGGGYAVFGEVVAGWDNVLAMSRLRIIDTGNSPYRELPVKENWPGNPTPIDGTHLVTLRTASVVTGAELIVDSFTAGSTISPGQNVTVNWKIKNVGSAAVNAAWTDRIVLSRNAVIGDSDDINLGDFAYSAGPLAAEGEVNREASVAIPFDPSLLPGAYSIFVVTDATNVINEIINDNNATAPSAATLVAAPSTIAGNPVGISASPTDSQIVGAINAIGRAIVLTPADNTPTAKWTVTDIQAATNSPAPLREVEAWFDPVNGLAQAATPAAAGLLLYERASNGAWSFRNLTTDLSGAAVIASEITVFTSTDNIVHVAGLTAGGELVVYRQVRGAGTVNWEFRNLSTQDLQPQGLTTPGFVGNVISYVTSWNGLNIAGLDGDGNIRSVWWAPGLANWTTSNLSAITGAPRLAGGLTAYLTSWNGINLAGIDVNGDVSTTWWVPEFGGDWRSSNLTTLFNFPRLTGGQLSSYVAPWGGLNIAGRSAEGKLSVYWWAPGLTNWNYSTDLVNTPLQPAGRLSGVTSTAGTTNIVSTTSNGSIFRYRWQASQPDVWTAQDITASALS